MNCKFCNGTISGVDQGQDLWKDNSIQFPRLIAELSAVSITDDQIQELCELMDLEPEQISELFERAEQEWQKIKTKHCPMGE